MKSAIVILLFFYLSVDMVEASVQKQVTLEGTAARGDEFGNRCYITLAYDANNKIVDIQAKGSVTISVSKRLFSLSRLMRSSQGDYHRIDHTENVGTTFGVLSGEQSRDRVCTGEAKPCVYQSDALFQFIGGRHYSLEESMIDKKESFKIILEQGRPVSAEINIITKMTSFYEGETRRHQLNCRNLHYIN